MIVMPVAKWHGGTSYDKILAHIYHPDDPNLVMLQFCALYHKGTITMEDGRIMPITFFECHKKAAADEIVASEISSSLENQMSCWSDVLKADLKPYKKQTFVDSIGLNGEPPLTTLKQITGHFHNDLHLLNVSLSVPGNTFLRSGNKLINYSIFRSLSGQAAKVQIATLQHL
jgi:hypothetical protein